MRQTKLPTGKFLKNAHFQNDFKYSNMRSLFYISMSKEYLYLVCHSSLVCQTNNINFLCVMVHCFDFYTLQENNAGFLHENNAAQ